MTSVWCGVMPRGSEGIKSVCRRPVQFPFILNEQGSTPYEQEVWRVVLVGAAPGAERLKTSAQSGPHSVSRVVLSVRIVSLPEYIS